MTEERDAKVSAAYRGLEAAARQDSPSAWASAQARLSAAETRLERDVANR